MRVPASARRALGALALAAVVAGCGSASGRSPAPTSGTARAAPTGSPSGARPGAARATSTHAAASSSRPASVPAPTGNQRFTGMHTDVGRMVWTTLTGARSGVRMRVWVWLPPQYDDPRYAHTAFPALMLYPGGSGAGYNTWVGRQYGGRELVAAGKATPFVFVMPEMQLSERLDTECADLPGQPKVGTFLAVDVRRMVEENFRVLRGRSGWGAAGASSGAYCATRLVFDHPGQYRAVVSIGGYYSIETGLRGASAPGVLAGDPAVVARTHPPDVAVLLWAGARNGIDLAEARSFLHLLRPPSTGRLQVLPGGRHLTTDFARMMPGSFAFLSAVLSKPSPAP